MTSLQFTKNLRSRFFGITGFINRILKRRPPFRNRKISKRFLGLSNLGFFIVDPAKRADTKFAGPPAKVYLTLRRRQPHNPASFLNPKSNAFYCSRRGRLWRWPLPSRRKSRGGLSALQICETRVSKSLYLLSFFLRLLFGTQICTSNQHEKSRYCEVQKRSV